MDIRLRYNVIAKKREKNQKQMDEQLQQFEYEAANNARRRGIARQKKEEKITL